MRRSALTPPENRAERVTVEDLRIPSNVHCAICDTFGARSSDAITFGTPAVPCLLAIERYLAYDGSSTYSFSLHG